MSPSFHSLTARILMTVPPGPGPSSREVIVLLLEDLSSQLTDAPDDPDLRRLRPPAYPDDAEADEAYQLLAGEELRTSHREAVRSVIASLERKQVTEEELWAWLRALNSVRLVAGTRLDITDDDHGPLGRPRQGDLSEQERSLWAVYDFCTYLQYEVVKGLAELRAMAAEKRSHRGE